MTMGILGRYKKVKHEKIAGILSLHKKRIYHLDGIENIDGIDESRNIGTGGISHDIDSNRDSSDYRPSRLNTPPYRIGIQSHDEPSSALHQSQCCVEKPESTDLTKMLVAETSFEPSNRYCDIDQNKKLFITSAMFFVDELRRKISLMSEGIENVNQLEKRLSIQGLNSKNEHFAYLSYSMAKHYESEIENISSSLSIKRCEIEDFIKKPSHETANAENFKESNRDYTTCFHSKNPYLFRFSSAYEFALMTLANLSEVEARIHYIKAKNRIAKMSLDEYMNSIQRRHTTVKKRTWLRSLLIASALPLAFGLVRCSLNLNSPTNNLQQAVTKNSTGSISTGDSDINYVLNFQPNDTDSVEFSHTPNVAPNTSSNNLLEDTYGSFISEKLTDKPINVEGHLTKSRKEQQSLEERLGFLPENGVLVKRILIWTPYETEVYWLKGMDDGKTAFITAPHGDETGAIMAANALKNAYLKKGNIILVPNANKVAIREKKRYTISDLNREFGVESNDHYIGKIAEEIKTLIWYGNVDVVLNLHEGRGYNSKDGISFGQSVVVDKKALSRSIQQTIDQINFSVPEKLKFKVFYKPMESTLTYFAAMNGKDAFGIETSKELPKEESLRLQLHVITSILNKYGIILEIP
ncbi:MAG: M99 family carboxypeptidase catalytic domain-containing protein [Candidatus Woesearchaeota archaeon]